MLGVQLNQAQQVIYDDLTTAAEIVGARVNPGPLSQTLQLFERFFSPYAEDTAVAYRVATNRQNLSMRYINFSVPHNPYEMALAAGLAEREGHPVEDVIDQVIPHVDMLGYGCDIVVSHGFEKIWPFFHMFPLEDLANFGVMPKALRLHLDYFAKFNLDQVSLFAIDYYHRTLNIYFMMRDENGFRPGGTLTRDQWVELFTDLGYAHPTDEELDIFAKAFTIYPTFSWDSDEIQRLCVCMPGSKLEDFPYYMHPFTEDFALNAPVQAAPTVYTYCPTYGRDIDPYLKMEVDYSGRYMQTCIGPLLQTL